MNRLFYLCPSLDENDSSTPEPQNDPTYRFLAPKEVANLVSSLCYDGKHLPVLDLDGADPGEVIEEIAWYCGRDALRVQVIPSTTRGHFHLYLDDLPLTWPEYADLLVSLAELKMIQESYASVSIARKATFVRKPGVKKPLKVAA